MLWVILAVFIDLRLQGYVEALFGSNCLRVSYCSVNVKDAESGYQMCTLCHYLLCSRQDSHTYILPIIACICHGERFLVLKSEKFSSLGVLTNHRQDPLLLFVWLVKWTYEIYVKGPMRMVEGSRSRRRFDGLWNGS